MMALLPSISESMPIHSPGSAVESHTSNREELHDLGAWSWPSVPGGNIRYPPRQDDPASHPDLLVGGGRTMRIDVVRHLPIVLKCHGAHALSHACTHGRVFWTICCAIVAMVNTIMMITHAANKYQM